MRSIRTRITVITMAAILVSVVAIGVIGAISIKNSGDQASNTEMQLLCDNKRMVLNEYLNSVQQSVNMVSRYASEFLNSIELMDGGVIGADGYGSSLPGRDWDSPQVKRLDEYLDRYTRLVNDVFHSIANHTNGVITYYYRLNPQISQTEKGFFYSKVNRSAFVEEQPLDITAYSPDDSDFVNWYYVSLQRGRPSWLEPYDNANLGLKVASFVSPVYKAGTFVGVIGMDISYETLVSQIEHITIYKSGYAFLADDSGRVIYHPTLKAGEYIERFDQEVASVIKATHNENQKPVLIHYTYEGVAKKSACATLANGLNLILAAPQSEISRGWRSMINSVVIFGLILLAVFAVYTTYVMKRITRPLHSLAIASQKLATGNYDVKLDYQGKDEVGVLTNSFQFLVNYLKAYISDLNSRAYKDALTSVKNKGAFDLYARKLDDLIHSDQNISPTFAIAMFDCNELKEINDAYGHDKGDLYLQTCCQLICKVFDHSPVFRLGGDEFCAVMQDEDYRCREKLMEEMEKRAAAINAVAVHAWDRISLAQGMAAFDPRRDSNSGDVLRRADEIMYRNKKEYKQSHGQTA